MSLEDKLTNSNIFKDEFIEAIMENVKATHRTMGDKLSFILFTVPFLNDDDEDPEVNIAFVPRIETDEGKTNFEVYEAWIRPEE